MFHLRASARHRAVAVALAFFTAGCATYSAGSNHGAPTTAAAGQDLSPAEERHAEALAQYGTGVSAELQGDLDTALAHYQQVLQLDPSYTALVPHVMQIYASKHDITNAVSVLESAI